jgi:6-phospho-beta-glucosidase
MKIAIIGGGSTYTPELFHGLLQRKEELGLHEVSLYDIRKDRLDPVVSFLRRMTLNLKSDISITTSDDIREILERTSFVIAQIRVGGNEARHSDTLLGLKYGMIGQETTGVGGFAKALRTIPVMMELSENISKYCPDSWLINFTNPSGIITESVTRFSKIKTVGLCNIPIEMKIRISEALGVSVKEIDLDYVGLNHLAWIRGIKINGKEAIDHVVSFLADSPVAKNIPEISYSQAFYRAFRMIPSPYLRYFYLTEEMYDDMKSKPRTRAEEVLEIEKKLFEYYSDPESVELPDLLNERGGAWYSRIAIDVMAALLKDEPCVEIVNTANSGAVSGIPDNAVMELPCFISREGIRPRMIGNVEEHIIGMIRQVKSYERLTVEAAIEKSYDRALLALINNPLVRNVNKAEKILNELIETGKYDLK